MNSGLSTSSKDAALIVAVEDYIFVPDVPGAQQNGRDWFKWFTKSQKIPISRVSLLENAKASKETIMDEAQRLAKQVRRGGKLWFVFIGHGAPSKNGRDGLILGVDVQQTASSIYARGVPQRQILKVLESSSVPVVAVIDACFSGKSSSGEALARGLQPLVVAQRRTKSKSTVLTAGKGDEFAGDLPGLSRPAFSYLALGALRGWGDSNKDGKVSAQEVVDYAREAILGLVQERTQTPQGVGRTLTHPLSRAAEQGPSLVDIRLGSTTTAPAAGVVQNTATAISLPPQLSSLSDLANKINATSNRMIKGVHRWQLGLEIGKFVRHPANARLAPEAKALGEKHGVWHDPSKYTFEQIWEKEKKIMLLPSKKIFGGGSLGLGAAILVWGYDEKSIEMVWAGAGAMGYGTLYLFLSSVNTKKMKRQVRQKYGFPEK